MGKAQKQSRGSKKRPRRGALLTWIVVAGVLGLVGYGISQMSTIAYSEDDIRVVNFSGLDEEQKTAALEEANRARCPCGCALGLAQCVATDPMCPIREENIERIKGMVRVAMTSKPSS